MSTVIVLGNVAFRPGGPMAKGDEVHGHAHNFDHVTMISHGSMRIDRLEQPTEEGGEPGAVLGSTTKSAKDARNFVLILAGTWHRLTALEDGTTYQCVYAHRDEAGEVVEEFTGWDAAYS